MMRTAKRVYSDAALEGWFARLSREWEAYFSTGELERGRDFYREGVVRELELGGGEVIVHAKVEEIGGCYVVVDWEGSGPEVRASVEDVALGRALAVAGLYEVEELVADELPDLPSERAEAKGGAAGAVAVEAGGGGEGTGGAGRLLALVFGVQLGGLEFSVWWEELGGKRVRALGAGAIGEVGGAEREKLIRLASLARRAGFRFDGKRGAYVMGDADGVPGFLRADWGVWERHFVMEGGEEVECLLSGGREVELEAYAREGEGGVRVGWRVRLGGVELSEQEGREVLRRGERLSVVAGRGLARLARADAEWVREWQEGVGGEVSVERYLLFSLFTREGVRVELGGELETWRNRFFEEPGEGLVLPDFLRPYQVRGARWLAHVTGLGCHALLADEMGLGKTLQVLSVLVASGGGPHLVVCPASVVPVWEGEVQRFFPGVVVRVLRKGEDLSAAREGELWVASYSQLRRHQAVLAGVRFGYAVLDEAQSVKNPDAKSAQACMSIVADKRLALTGTPIENRHLDLWTIFRFLMPGLLGGRRRFEEGVRADGAVFLEKLRRQIAPFVLRRTKREVLSELPPKIEVDLLCPLSDVQRGAYEEIAEGALRRFGEGGIAGALEVESRLSFLTVLMRLRQACCDAGLLPGVEVGVEHSGKLAVLAERLEELFAGGRKVVVFSQFVSLLRRVRVVCEERFPDVPLMELTGGTRDRGAPVAKFQQKRGAALMLASLKAGGTGITLHAADYVFLLDPWWNPAAEAQAVDRVHRLGQRNTVFVYRLIAPGTVEERVRRLQGEKKRLFEEVLGGMADVSEFARYFENLRALLGYKP